MAFTAAPVLGEFWMDKDQKYFDLVTKKLRSAQSALAAAHKRFMFQFQKKFPLPGEQMIWPCYGSACFTPSTPANSLSYTHRAFVRYNCAVVHAVRQ